MTANGGQYSSWDRLVAALESGAISYKTSRQHHIDALCPAHSDDRPSLNIDYDPAGEKVLLDCKAGCDYHDIIGALGMSEAELFDDFVDLETYKARKAAEREADKKASRRSGGRAGGPGRGGRDLARASNAERAAARPRLPQGRLPARLTKPTSKRVSDEQLVCFYDYTDAHGEVLHRVNRWEYDIEVTDPVTGETTTKRTKDFRQAWPAADGGWLSKTPKGFRPQLYRLPGVVEAIANGEMVWLGEGEKDGDQFADRGACGTTNPGGAGGFTVRAAVDGYVSALRGAHVTIVVDHDLAGYKRAVEVYERLVRVAASVRIALPKPSEPHQDAADHFAAGYDLDDFVEISIARMRLLYAAAQAEKYAEDCKTARAEADARAELAEAGTDVEENARFAGRWAAEAGKWLDRCVEITRNLRDSEGAAA
jgi:hypothetical protein